MNGKTIHVVQRSPSSARAASATGASSSAAEPGQVRGERPRMDGNSFVVGSFSLPPDANEVHVSMFALVLNTLILKFTEDLVVIILFCCIALAC